MKGQRAWLALWVPIRMPQSDHLRSSTNQQSARLTHWVATQGRINASNHKVSVPWETLSHMRFDNVKIRFAKLILITDGDNVLHHIDVWLHVLDGCDGLPAKVAISIIKSKPFARFAPRTTREAADINVEPKRWHQVSSFTQRTLKCAIIEIAAVDVIRHMSGGMISEGHFPARSLVVAEAIQL